MNLIELERLLYAMDHQDEHDVEETWHSLQFKLNRCFSLWQNVQVALEETNNDPTMPKLSRERFEYLQNRVMATNDKYTALIAQRKEHDKSDDLIHRVFVARSVQQQQSSADSGRGSSSPGSSVASAETDSIEPLENRYTNELIRKRPTSNKQPEDMTIAPNVEELQKMQREQVEEAISHMASQLKVESARINETLVRQTEGLGELEDTVTEKVKQVSDVAKDVEEHVQSSWNRNIGTWTLFFTMVGVFVFMLVIIQMAPKGKGCVFFCPEKPRPDEFCRTLKNGRLECIRMDEEPGTEQMINQPESGDFSTSTTQDEERDIKDQAVSKEEESCEMNEYGECIQAVQQKVDSTVAKAFGIENDMPKSQKEKVSASGTEDSMFGSSSIETNILGEGKRPIYNRKHFSPRDIRTAANLGDYYLLEGYLTIKPEWVNKVDKNGWAALHLSARRGDLRAIHFLKRVGADLTLKTVDGRTAWDIAVLIYEEGHPVVEALKI